MTARILFDWGATRSFVSFALNKKFSDASQTLDFPLEVKIIDDRLVSSSKVHRGYVLNMFNMI